MDISQNRLREILPLANQLEMLERHQGVILPNATGITIQVAMNTGQEGVQPEGFELRVQLGANHPSEATLRKILDEALTGLKAQVRQQMAEKGFNVAEVGAAGDAPATRQQKRATASKVAKKLINGAGKPGKRAAKV